MSWNTDGMYPLDQTKEEEYVETRTFSNLNKRLFNWAIELEAPYEDNPAVDRFNLPIAFDQSVKFKCNLFIKKDPSGRTISDPYNFHHDGSGPQEINIPYTNMEHLLKERMERVLSPFRWNPYSSVGGSAHIHISMLGPFKDRDGAPTAAMSQVAVAYNTLRWLAMLALPFWIWDSGRRSIFKWAYPTLDPVTPAQVREAFTTGNFKIRTFQDGVLAKKPVGHHGSPYCALQWNRHEETDYAGHNAKPITLEFRLNEQHPNLTFGVLSCISSLLKTRVALLRSLDFEFVNYPDRDLLKWLWARWWESTGKSDADIWIMRDGETEATYRERTRRHNSAPEGEHAIHGAWLVLDVPEPIRFKKNVPKLCYNASKRYKKTEWESPLQFFKELCLFMKYEKIYNRLRGTYNKVDAGIIMLLFANGLLPEVVPSYLLWDIKRLYHYTFFEGKGHKWSYKGGLLTPEERAEHCPRLVDENNVDLIKTTDDPYWGSW